MDNLEQLKKLGTIFNSDKLVTSDDIAEVLKGILGLLSNFKKSNEELNSETKQVVNELFQSITEEHEKMMDKIEEGTNTALNTKEELQKTFEEYISDVKTMMDDMMNALPEDGKDGIDADEEAIIEKVMTQIKLPEYKEVILDDGEQIANKLEALEGEAKLDFKALKNVPEFKGGKSGGVVARNIYQMGDVSLTALANNDVLKWDDTNKLWVNGVGGAGASPLTTKGDIYTFTTVDARLGVGANGEVLTADSSTATGLKWAAVTGTGTVTDVLVVSANGFAGTVATSTTTPAITLTTSVTGLLKGNGTAISAATAGTDYQAAITGSDTHVLFFDGANNPAGEAGFTYDKTTDSLTLAGKMNSASANISGLTASKVVFTDASKNLTSTGIGNSTDFIKGDGSLDGSTYLTGNQTIALSGDVSGTGSTSITTTIGAGVVGIAMLSATGTPSATTFLRGDNTWATPAGSGTVTNTGGNLTANSVVLGAGTSDVKVVAGVTTNGAGQLVLGVNATTLGNVKMFGSTSGDVTFGPAAVAGTATVFTLPPDNGTNGYYLKTNGSGVTTWAAATGGLTNWTEALTTAAPNATINVSSFTATNGTTHQDAAFIPKGSSGSVIVAIPDNTTTGGNKRGTASVDLQLTRTAASQVVSGSYSFGVGARNTVSGDWSGAIGFNNNVSGYSSFAAGESNTVSNGPGMAVGSSNTVSGLYSAALGRTHTVSGINSFAYGEGNTASTSYTFAGGLYADAYLYGMRSTASGRFAAVGDAQAPDLVWRRSITGTSATELFLDGASIRAILKSGNTVWNATIQVVATIQTVGNGTVTLGDSFVGTYAVGIKRIGSSTALIGTVDTVSGDNDTGMAGAAVTITADDTNEALKIEFTPPTLAGTTTVTRVVARGTIAEVRY